MKRLLLLAALLLLPACSPLSVTFTLGAHDDELKETSVLGDTSAPAKVALIDVRGLIIDAPRPGLLSVGASPVDDLVARLKLAEEDAAVKAIVLRINSPGGTVTASDTMYREVRRFAQATKKPVVASMGEVAASGGYYLSLSADEIVAQPTTITASIGVIMETINVSEGLQKIGIVSRPVKSGANKDMGNPMVPMRESQYALLQGMVDEFYGRFRALVVERRPKLNTGRLDELTDGRIVTGADAVKEGLADREGDLRDAYERAKALAGITSARLVKYHYGHSKPLTPYGAEALAEGRSGAGGGPSELNLVQVKLGEGGLSGLLGAGNAYYLWTGGLP